MYSDIQQILDTSFNALNKSAPRPLKMINATQYFNDFKLHENKFKLVSGATNARIGMFIWPYIAIHTVSKLYHLNRSII